MKVYIYGTYVRGESGRRIREYENCTTDPFKAFYVCYQIGLDGNDYFLIAYDVDTATKKQIFINSAEHDKIWSVVKRNIEKAHRAEKSNTQKLDAMRAEDV